MESKVAEAPESMSSSQSHIATASEFLNIADVLLKHRFKILGITVGVTILTVIVVFLIPNQYTGESVVMPPSQSSTSSLLLNQLSGSNPLAASAGASFGLKNPSDLYVSLFRARTVEDAVIARFHLMSRYKEKRQSDARKAFEKHAQVALGTKDGLITISVTDRDKQMAADIANGYVDEYRKFSADLAVTEASRRRIFFQQQMKEANENLVIAENSLKQSEQVSGVLQIDSQTRALIQSAASLRAEVTAKEVQIQAMRSYATEDNPSVVTATQELNALKEQESRLTGGGQGTDEGLLVPGYKVPEASIEYIRHLRDVKYYEVISEIIGRQFETAKLDEARQGNGVQVIDVAVIPDRASFPKRSLLIAGAFFAALALSSGWFVFAESRKVLKNLDTA